MKKLTVRLEDYIYDRLYLVANDNTTSVNKVVASILEKYINEPREINYLKEIDEKLKKGVCKMVKGLVRTTLRIDNNLKTRIELLAIKNNLSFNKMLTYLIELGYNSYMEKFDKYYEIQNKKIESEEEDE